MNKATDNMDYVYIVRTINDHLETYPIIYDREDTRWGGIKEYKTLNGAKKRLPRVMSHNNDRSRQTFNPDDVANRSEWFKKEQQEGHNNAMARTYQIIKVPGVAFRDHDDNWLISEWDGEQHVRTPIEAEVIVEVKVSDLIAANDAFEAAREDSREAKAAFDNLMKRRLADTTIANLILGDDSNLTDHDREVAQNLLNAESRKHDAGVKRELVLAGELTF